MPDFGSIIGCANCLSTDPQKSVSSGNGYAFGQIKRESAVRSQIGYTLVEILMVIIIIGILATAAYRSLGNTIDVSRSEETRQEMEQLAYAIAGNPDLVSGGTRIDFGYVGDIGALPPDWDALLSNPGYTTWDGPYIQDEFTAGTGDIEFKLDAWGQVYTPPANGSFSSTGGPEMITRRIANSVDDLLCNSVIISVRDLNGSPPGNMYRDSVRILLTYPDGYGAVVTKSLNPAVDGLARFDSIPIGLHDLRLIYIPDNDTLARMVAVNPGRDYYADIQYVTDAW